MSARAVLGHLLQVTGRVEVTGTGVLADEVRVLLGERAEVSAEEPPIAVVETTGEPASVAAALERVADLGTVVLAGPPPAGTVPLDLYSNLHVRGLVLVGIPLAKARPQ